MTTPADWATGVREGTAPAGAVPATNETPETPDPVVFPGADDPGGRDDVAASVAAAVANAEARYGEHERDTYAQGSTIGDLMTLPPGPLDPGVAGGLTDPSGAFYDPPREGAPETFTGPGNQP